MSVSNVDAAALLTTVAVGGGVNEANPSGYLHADVRTEEGNPIS